MKLYVKLEAPFEWVRVTGTTVDAFGEVPGLADYPLTDEDELVGVVAGEWVTAHRISLPAKSKRQFQLAVPYALEELISEDVEFLHFVCPRWKSGEDCTVYVVAKQKMRYWQSLANKYKLPLDSIVADHSLLPFHSAADCSIALINSAETGEQHILTRQKLMGGVSIDPDFLDVWLMDVPMVSTIAVNDKELTERLIESHSDRDFRHWSFGNKMAHWLEHQNSTEYDLFTDEYRPSVRRFEWGSFALPLGVLTVGILLIFSYDVYRYFALHSEIRLIDDEQQKIMATTFPSIDFVEPGKERYMMEQALARMRGGPELVSLQSILAETAAVLRRQRVTMSNIVFRDSEMIITCQLNDFSQVDKLSTELNARPKISASLQSSAADDGQIVASYSIRSS